MPTFRTFDGLDLHWSERGSSTGSLVVLLHGFASDGEANWVRTGIADAVGDAGFRVVVPDARGHGASSKPLEPDAYRPPAMARDVVALLDHLDARAAHVVGYSLGVMTAITAAALDPRIDRLVLGGAGGTLLRSGGQAHVRRRQLGAAVLEVDDPSTLSDPAARGLRTFVDRSGGDRLALAAVMRAEEGPPPEALRIPNPVLVLAGRGDAGAGAPEDLAAVLPNASSGHLHGDHLAAVRDPAFPRRIVEFLSAPVRTRR